MAVTPNRQRGWLPPETPITGTRWMLCAIPDDSQLRYREAFLGAMWKLAIPYYWEHRETLDVEAIALAYQEYWWQSMDITEAIQEIINQLTRIADNGDLAIPELSQIATAQSVNMPLQTAAQEAQAVALGADVVVPGSASVSSDSSSAVPVWQSLVDIGLGVYAPKQVGNEQVVTYERDTAWVYLWVPSEDWTGSVTILNNGSEAVQTMLIINNSDIVFFQSLSAGFGQESNVSLNAGDRLELYNVDPVGPWPYYAQFTPTIKLERRSLVDKEAVIVNENTYTLEGGGCCDPPETVASGSPCQPMRLVAGSGTQGQTGVELKNGEYGRWEAEATKYGESFITVSYNLVNNDSDLLTLTYAINGTVKDVQQATASGQTTFNSFTNTGDIVTIIAQAITGSGNVYFEINPISLCENRANNDYLILSSDQSALRAAGTAGREALKLGSGEVRILANGTAELSQGINLDLTNIQISATGPIDGTLKLEMTNEAGTIDTVYSGPISDDFNTSLDIGNDTWRWVKATIQNTTSEAVDLLFKVWGQYDS